MLKYETKFQKALKPNNLSKALKYHIKLSIKYMLVRITETHMQSMKHLYCNLGGIRHMLHENDMLFY